MPRTAAPADVFNAIAEPRRRQILEVLADGAPRPVGELVRTLHLRQPSVSKHLGVLRKAGLVAVTRRGQSRLYRLEPRELRTVHEWVRQYERLWTHQLERIQSRAERAAEAAFPRRATAERAGPCGNRVTPKFSREQAGPD